MASLIDLDAFIKELSKHIGIDWKALARELGLSKTDIDALQQDNILSMRDQIFEFFYKWKQQEGSNASVQKLIDGLKAANLVEQTKKMKEAGLMPEIQLQYIREKQFSSDPSSTLAGSSRETQRTLSTGSTTTGAGEQECPPPLLLTKEGDLSTTTDGNTKPPADRPFEVGDMVKVEQKDSPWYGVIRWIGQLPTGPEYIAGIEMENKVDGGRSGEFQEVQYFICPPGQGIFFRVDQLKRDDRFKENNIETDETRRVSGSLSKSAPHQQPQASGVSNQSTLDALKELEAAQSHLSDRPEQPEASSEDSSDKPFNGLLFCIPGDQTGFVIGREGKNITRVESETNTSINVKGPGNAQSTQNATIVIIGSKENCNRAVHIILQDLSRKMFQHLATTETVIIPNRQKAGKVIGKGGSTRNAIEKLSGAQVRIEDREGLDSYFDNSKICKITGMAEEVEKARELIDRAMHAGSRQSHCPRGYCCCVRGHSAQVNETL